MSTYTGADKAIDFLFTMVSNIAEDYDDSATYAVNDYAVYGGVLYKCTSNILVAEDFTPAHWTAVLVMDEISAGGGGGGSTTLAGLSDVALATVSNGDVLTYDGTSNKWKNAAGGGGGGHNYSTTEHIVGTWIDGSTVYEKTVFLQNAAYTQVNTQFEIMSIPNIGIPIDIRGCFSNSAKTVYHEFAYVATDSARKGTYIDVDMTNSRIVFVSQDTWGSTNIIVTVRYTKTV